MANFNKYDNPQMAKRIWNEYEQDLSELGGSRRGLSILWESKTTHELDCRLDLLFTSLKRKRMPAHSSPVPPDRDAQGYHTIALRILEECR